MHTAWRAEYSQKCTPLPMGPACGRREASRSFAERGLAHCLAGRGPAAGLWCCGKRPCSCLAVWQMSDGVPDARTLCVRGVMKKPSRPYWAARQSNPLIWGIRFWLVYPSSMPSRVRQANSAHLTRAGMCEISWSWAASSRSSRSSSESCSPRIMARKSSARR